MIRRCRHTLAFLATVLLGGVGQPTCGLCQAPLPAPQPVQPVLPPAPQPVQPGPPPVVKPPILQPQVPLPPGAQQPAPQPPVFQTPPPPPPPTSPPPPLFPFWYLLVFLPLLLHQAQQEKQRKKQQADEEENRTPYTEEDLMQDWEFKILRCQQPAFHRPDFLHHVLAEEALSGWRLVEVFDGQRVRLKRPSERRADVRLTPGLDPYRLTVVDPWAGARARRALSWVVCGVGILVTFIGVLIILIDPRARMPGAVTAGIGSVLALAFGVLAARTRMPALPRGEFPDEPPAGPGASTSIREL